MLNTSALAWAAARSGLSFGEFLSTLTPDREAAILEEYNTWRQEKGLAPVAAAPRPQIEVPRPAKPVEAPDEPEDEPADDEVPAEDGWAPEAEREDFESFDDPWNGASEAEELLGDVPFELPDEELVAPETFAPAANDVPQAEPEAPAESAPEKPRPVRSAIPATNDLMTLLAKLPKEPDEAYYRAVQGAAETVEALRAAALARIEARRKSRKSTVPLKAFLAWLDGQSAE